MTIQPLLKSAQGILLSGASALDLWSGNRSCIFRPRVRSGSQLERLYLPGNASQCPETFLTSWPRGRERVSLMWVGRAVDRGQDVAKHPTMHRTGPSPERVTLASKCQECQG